MTQDKSSWKEIEQLLTSPAITPIAKHRRRWIALKRVALVLVVLVVVGLCLSGFWFLRTHSRTLAPYVQKTQTNIVFFSDGQLTRNWFDEHFQNLGQKGLLSIDINAIQSAILRDSQVLSVSVERHFPSTLRVNIRERRPLGRIKVREAGHTQIYYLSPDGTFYTSADYIPPINLPFITAADIVATPDGLAPLPGASTIAEIINGLKTDYPQLASEMAYLNLKSWVFPITEQTCVAIDLRQNTTLRFSGNDIPRQLARLREVLNLLEDEHGSIKNKTIDLTYPDRVAIVDK
jgi:hypothetical protein